LKVDPQHRQQVDGLLELAQRVSERAFARYSAQKVCSRSLLTQLSCLMKAVQRQRRHLRQIAGAPVVRYEFVVYEWPEEPGSAETKPPSR
jgi:predicted exporter